MARMQGHGDDGAAAEKVAVTDLPTSARFSLRAGAEGRAAAADALGMHLPVCIGARVTAGGRSALCLGPDEWVIHAAHGDGTAIREAFAAASATAPLSLVDVSRREIALAVEGPAALDLLTCFCPRDLEALAVGAGCRTLLDSVQVVLLREGADRFTVEIGRSFAPHLRALFDLAIRAGL
jgi:sarcosine oxidase, subunit gamma